MLTSTETTNFVITSIDPVLLVGRGPRVVRRAGVAPATDVGADGASAQDGGRSTGQDDQPQGVHEQRRAHSVERGLVDHRTLPSGRGFSTSRRSKAATPCRTSCWPASRRCPRFH